MTGTIGVGGQMENLMERVYFIIANLIRLCTMKEMLLEGPMVLARSISIKVNGYMREELIKVRLMVLVK
jgi:hypothetical protein